MSKAILFMAGGTGGHVFPALAVAKEMAEKGYDIHWLGTSGGIEKDLVPAAGYPLHCIDIAGLRGKGKLGLLSAPFRILKAIWQAKKVIKMVKPVAALGMGGYATGPGGVAARLTAVPLLIHEQNAFAGMTNKLLHKISQTTMQAFPGALENALVTGNPVRKDVQQIRNQISASEQRLKVLVVGGSLGAVALNQTVLEAMTGLEEALQPDLWHQAGKRNIEDVQKQYQLAGIDARVTAFIDDMAAAYEWADLVVCRAGALTVSEVAAAGKAAIFVPFPFAVDDHQTANAQYLADKNAALICQQEDLSAGWLASQWKEFSNNKMALQQMADTARQLAMPNATQMVVEQIERFSRES
ncbi:MAG: undecaprenyldiphospho-muramoylpentapeptide beta-N-acetylglucosaminyltransferase [Saccharospirillaceae bacterium]|nr:UDP-N-acetylglucosamine--N-acetylmuramyl-(pentapeptide) pyrophosphoryl-undecaprenol N-acetylglucosamine transferase [Thalassolituus sp. HI0120]MCH2040632.1 undecaprenyldiphospho-muramoylpentapeptide beta-N-acetylglucosaminyltransferase [Saccharospirillaceae bacterium]